MEFTKIHGVGSSTARELYDKHGCRTLADVAKISHKLPSMSEKSIEREFGCKSFAGGPARNVHADLSGFPCSFAFFVKTLNSGGGFRRQVRLPRWRGGTVARTVRLTGLCAQCKSRIPRAEVEEIARTIDRHLQAIIVSCPYRPKPQLVRSDLDAEYLVQPGAIYTICGGYRRGKMESNDVDIVFTHPQESMEKGALEKLLDRLQQAGLGEWGDVCGGVCGIPE